MVNAAGAFSALGGSLLAPLVIDAMREAAGQYVDLGELQAAVGARIARLTGNEAAYVSAGAAAGMVVAVAACVAGTDPTLIASFPQVGGAGRDEVVVFGSQRNGYDYAIRQTGVRLVEVKGSQAALAEALSDRSACVMFFAGAHFAAGALPIEQTIAVARAAGVPVLVNAAAQVPPVSSLWRFTRHLGADAVIVSGGKGLGGPQPSGLVLGRREVIEACRANGSPNVAIGRPMKVGREEMLGLLAAVELALERDETAMLAGFEDVVRRWIAGLAGIPGVSVERGYPSIGGLPHGRAIVRFAPPSPWTRDLVEAALWAHEPRIAVVAADADPTAMALNPQLLRPGEDQLVLDVLRQILTSQPAALLPGYTVNRRSEDAWTISTQGWTAFSSSHLPASTGAAD